MRNLTSLFKLAAVVLCVVMFLGSAVGDDGFYVIAQASMVWKGDWNISAAYKARDVVFYNGSSWFCLAANTGQAPNNNPTQWTMLCQKGDTGASPWGLNGLKTFYTQGNVGIGTNNPDYPLTVSSTGSAIYGYATNDGATGVYGYSPSLYGSGNGVLGIANSAWGFGVHGINNGGFIGVYGESGGAGVSGYSSGENGRGIEGISDGGYAYGVYGNAISPQGFGVFCLGNFYVKSPFTPKSVCFARIEGSLTLDYNLSVHGNKNAVVPTSQGDRKLYCQESPEVWFEDFGEGQLNGGKTRIDLDPLFLETVTIDARNPLKVFIQLNDDCNGVYVKRQATSFEVKELQNGNSSASFTYRVVAKRKGYETARLESAPEPTKVASLQDAKK
jgi:hypothetical protein